MSRTDPERLADMVTAAAEIDDIVGRGRDVYDHDVAIRRAIERCIEIFGEAAKSLSVELRERYPEVPWSDIAKIRDRLSHHYHRIDHAQLWVIATTNVPAAAAQIRRIASS